VHSYEQRVADSFQPVVNAARHLIVTAGYVVVVVLTTMFVLHVVGWTLCRCLRLRLDVPLELVDSRQTAAPASSSIQTFIRHSDPVDVDDVDDDDDEASDYYANSAGPESARMDSLRRRGAAQDCVAATRSRRSDAFSVAPSPAAGAVEFRYSETNV